MLTLARGARITELLGSRGGWIQADHESELIAPVPAGVPLTFRGSIAEKFERNGRFWIVEHLEVAEARDGATLLRERRRFIVPRAAAGEAAAR
jgi:hypothetical protein